MLVKIVRKLNRKVGNETYYKYLAPISTKQMEELDWNEDTQIKTKIQGKKLIIEKDSKK